MEDQYLVDPHRRDLIEECRRKPGGRHSGELQRLLNILRGGPLEGKYVLVRTKPDQEWVLAQLSGIRGEPVRIHSDQVFHSLEAAEWAVFKRRWQQLTGQTPEF